MSNRRRALLPPERFDDTFDLRLTTAGDPLPLFALDAERPVDDLIEDSYARSPFLQEIIAWLTDGRQHRKWPPSLKIKLPIAEIRVERGRIYCRGRLVVDPADTDLQTQLIYRAHNTRGAGHPGRTKTLDLMNRTY